MSRSSVVIERTERDTRRAKTSPIPSATRTAAKPIQAARTAWRWIVPNTSALGATRRTVQAMPDCAGRGAALAMKSPNAKLRGSSGAARTISQAPASIESG